jgi:hypothetical protein
MNPRSAGVYYAAAAAAAAALVYFARRRHNTRKQIDAQLAAINIELNAQRKDIDDLLDYIQPLRTCRS